MRKGQSNIIVFPILIMIIVAAWFLATSSIFNLTTESHAAFVEMGERQKAFMDSAIEHDELPSPISDVGRMSNKGLVALTGVEAYHLSTGVSQSSISPIFFQGDTIEYSLENPQYGDVIVIKSGESFWGTTIVPKVRYANAALRIGTFAGENQAVIETFSDPASTSYYTIGTVNNALRDALAESEDGVYFIFQSNKEGELAFDPGNKCLALAIQMQVNGLNNGTSDATLGISPWDGNAFTLAYTCKYPQGSYTECYTPDLSGNMVQDGTKFKIRLKSGGQNVYLDYGRLRAKCIT